MKRYWQWWTVALLSLVATPLPAQLAGTCTLVSSGNYFVVRVELLADQPIQTATYDESVIWAWSVSFRPTEFGFHVRANTSARVLWSVVQIGPPLPVTRAGNAITVGSQSFTITTQSVVGG